MNIRKTFLTLAAATALPLAAQNIQLHYDLGRTLYNSLGERALFTTTVEMFKPDRLGSTYFFVDMDYTSKGVSSAYWEIFREFKCWKAPVWAHVEYNGGLNFINNAYLAGPAYNWANADFSRVFGLQVLYKYIQKNARPHNFQLTASWTLHLARQKFTLSGFADFWQERHTDAQGRLHRFVFLSEPQFWVNLDKFPHVSDDLHLSVGTEWEFSTNFADRNGFYFIPTLAMKWSF